MATRWIQTHGSMFTQNIQHLLFHTDDPALLEHVLEISIYEWSGEPLTGADPAQIGAFHPKRRSTHFHLHPEAFAEVWAASEAGSREKLSIMLELKPIDPDLYAVVEVTFEDGRSYT